MTTRVSGYILKDGKRTWVDITVENDTKPIQVTTDSSVEVEDGEDLTKIVEHVARRDWTIWSGGTKHHKLSGSEGQTVAIFNILPGFDRWLYVERQKSGTERL